MGLRRPLVIAHRGASGYRPEHTLASYELAILQGADFIEPDLVLTKDRVLIARHEPEIGDTTDVSVRFPNRRRTVVVDGAEVTGWFVEDFTLEEIKRLRARERLPHRSHDNDGIFEIPTLDEIVGLVRSKERELGRRIGIYPETKHPSYHEERGLPITRLLIEALERHGYSAASDPVFIQSFETGNLRWAKQHTALPLVQLIDVEGGPADWSWNGRAGTETGVPRVGNEAGGSRAGTETGGPRVGNEAGGSRAGTETGGPRADEDFGAPRAPRRLGGYREMCSKAGLKEVASYASAIGVAKQLVQPIRDDGTLGEPTTLVADAHAVSLAVHVWTIRADREFLPAGYRSDPEAEVKRLAELGVDGMFTDFPDIAVRALRS